MLVRFLSWIPSVRTFHGALLKVVKLLLPQLGSVFGSLVAMATGECDLSIGGMGVYFIDDLWVDSLCSTWMDRNHFGVILQSKPFWKPSNPKRFAWFIGLILSTTCFILVQHRHELGAAYKPTVTAVAFTCSCATCLEGNAGFCIGRFVYNDTLTKYCNYEECEECKL